jgi:hypothetical protein
MISSACRVGLFVKGVSERERILEYKKTRLQRYRLGIEKGLKEKWQKYSNRFVRMTRM